MKTKIFLPFKRLQKTIEEKPEKSALIVSSIITVPMAIFFTLSLTDKSLVNLISVLFILLCVSGLFWFMFAMMFVEKKQKELSEQALKSGLEVMINQALIGNGSIIKPEEMVKL